MVRPVHVVALMTWMCCAAAMAGDLRVNGEPPLGAFGVDTLEHVHECAKLGMNLVYTYKADVGKRQLDLGDPIGKAVAEHKMGVMYLLSNRFTRVRLARDIAADDTTIPVTGMERTSMDAFAPSGALSIGDERIVYSGRTLEAFTGCQRGVEGTKPARHGAGLWLCNAEKLREEILAVKDSPNLWGFWLVDDARPNEGDSLRQMSRVIRQHDRRADGTPYGHVIVMGVGAGWVMEHFSPGVCDALGVYLYPYRKGKLDLNVRKQMDYIAHRAKAVDPAVGLIGIYQAFGQEDSQSWRDMPKPEEVREDILSYMQYGAAGVMGFIYHWQRPNAKPFGFNTAPQVCEAVAQVYQDIRKGKVRPGAPALQNVEWHQILFGGDARSSDGIPALDLADAKSVEALCRMHGQGRIVHEAKQVDGQSYPLRMVIPKYEKDDPKSQRWPGVTFRGECLSVKDWSGFRYVEQALYSPMENAIPLRVWLSDEDGGGWERGYLFVPPRTPVLLRVPMSEAMLTANLRKIRHWMLWFNEPKDEIALHIGSPVLVPK